MCILGALGWEEKVSASLELEVQVAVSHTWVLGNPAWVLGNPAWVLGNPAWVLGIQPGCWGIQPGFSVGAAGDVNR